MVIQVPAAVIAHGYVHILLHILAVDALPKVRAGQAGIPAVGGKIGLAGFFGFQGVRHLGQIQGALPVLPIVTEPVQIGIAAGTVVVAGIVIAVVAPGRIVAHEEQAQDDHQDKYGRHRAHNEHQTPDAALPQGFAGLHQVGFRVPLSSGA